MLVSAYRFSITILNIFGFSQSFHFVFQLIHRLHYLPASASAENPAKTTLWSAPIRTQASMEATASGDTGLIIREGVISDKGFVRVIHRNTQC